MKCFILLLILLSFSFQAYGENKSTTYTTENSPDWVISHSYTDGPVKVNPGENIFSFRDKRKGTDLSHYDQYQFIGRTGTDTFEMKHNYGRMQMKNEETLKMFFEKDSTFPLEFWFGYTSCNNEKIELKMLNLQGNQLEYEIILPQCLKDNIK